MNNLSLLVPTLVCMLKNIHIHFAGIVFVGLVVSCHSLVYAGNDQIEIERFDHLNTRNGLSQNSVLSAYCDHLGFLWFGTMNGLNRYDGYSFKIYKARPGEEYMLSNNRISGIWEDQRGFLWVNTYDGYYHYLDREHDRFITFPFYDKSEEERNSAIKCFSQINKNEIWLGSDNSGIYRLLYDSLKNGYSVQRLVSRGVNAITNNTIRFILSDPNGNIWIGTLRGLNFFPASARMSGENEFHHFLVNEEFTAGAATDNEVWFGTRKNGIILYSSAEKKFIRDAKLPEREEITLLVYGKNGYIAAGTGSDGLYIIRPVDRNISHFSLPGKKITRIYEDRQGMFWVNTNKFGVSRIDPASGVHRTYTLTPVDIQPLIDDERQYFFEDSKGNLWIGLHGGGLALYDRMSDQFRFFRNNPVDPKTISSNFVHCITEDKSGLLWVGTGQSNGGINKVIPANNSFRHIFPKIQINDISENVIRCIFQDSNNKIWVATKSGKLYVYDENFTLQAVFDNIPLVKGNVPVYNVYTILEDSKGYLWLGSKGGGVAVSRTCLKDAKGDYRKLKFDIYRHDSADSTSLSGDMIYSILEDRQNRIWIGTYGDGLNLVTGRDHERLRCRHINRKNSNLSSDVVRQVFEDSEGNLWIATIFGVNCLRNHSLKDSAIFENFRYNPQNRSSLSYNDVIHIYEDSRKRLWFGTFGGGLNLYTGEGKFKRYTQLSGLANDAVFGILEDKNGYLWLSTENGLSRFDVHEEKFESYNENNGLVSASFNENACCRTRSGLLLFGANDGLLIVTPAVSKGNGIAPPLVLTNFQLFNKDVSFNDPDSPLKTTIETAQKIVLRYNQSSFSIDYAALSFFDPEKNQYAFMLENFDKGWNMVKGQRRATYTNIPPGDYIFKLKGAGSDGTWTPVPLSLKITVLPPWWKTWYAYLSYFIMFLFLAEMSRRIIVRYIHLRNELRVERRVNEIKLQFFTNISHEIRTPLTLILGPLEDIRRYEHLPVQLQRPVDIMYRNGQRMLRLINQLLDFRKIQNNKMTLRVHKVNYPEFLKEVCRNFDHMAERKGIRFVNEIPDNTIEVWIDPEKVDSILFNLLSNAFKFTPSGGTISVTLGVNEKNGCFDTVIADQGPGIPADKIPLIFSRYTSFSAERKYFSSTGLGLALSKELALLHSGDILVESIPETGSVFTLRLPLGKDHFKQEELCEEAQPAISVIPDVDLSDESVPEPLVSKSPGSKIVVVEDNHEILDYVSSVLSERFSVVSASNGKEGLEIVRKELPDLIIADIMMPELDGLEMTRRIKEDFRTSHIPVILLTALSDIEEQIEGIKTGAEAYVLKPFHAVYLKELATTLIKQRAMIFQKVADKNILEPGDLKITSRDEEFIRKIISHIGENYSNPDFNVEKLVELSGCGRTVFYNKIKSFTGLSPVEFLRQMRLKIAAKYLLAPGYNVSEIAYLCGFNDEKYFRKCFRDLYGMTPTEYRNKNGFSAVKTEKDG